MSSKWWRSALKWFKSQIWEVWWKQFNRMLELYLLQVTFYLINASNKFQTACISSHLQHEIKENWSKTYDIHIFHWEYITFLMKNKPLKGKCLKSESRKLSAFLPINFVLGKKMVNRALERRSMANGQQYKNHLVRRYTRGWSRELNPCVKFTPLFWTS